MKALLINPPRDNEIIGNNPPIIEKERGFNPPLGLLYLARYVEEHSNHDIKVIDAQVETLSYSELRTKIEEFTPDVVGITAMTLTLIDVLKTVDLVKEVNPDIRTVLGGPHVYLFPHETINFEHVDYLVLGEGERTFAELLRDLDQKDKLRRIPGLFFKDDGVVSNTGPPRLIQNLDEIPFPARHLTPYKKYSSLLATGSTVTTIFTSRGCPFRCSFCARPHLGNRFRFQSAERVVDELQECKNMGIDDFLFYDDTFCINKQRVIDICKDIVSRRLDIRWDIRARIDTVNDEMLKHLKMAGCQGIHYGIEAGTERILRVLKKGITLEQARSTIELTHKHKLPVLAYFMIGNPTETKEDIYETFRVMKELNPDYVHMTILTPFPGTEIYLDGLKRGIIKEDCWREFAKNPTPDFVAPHWDEIFSREELNDLLVQGYKGFYMRPRYILQRLKALRSFPEFKRKLSAGLRVMRMRGNAKRDVRPGN